MVLIKGELLDFLKKNGKDRDIIYLLNSEDEMYYTINDVRIDTEGDIVFDISFSDV